MAALDRYLAALTKNNGTHLHLKVGMAPALRIERQIAAFNVAAITGQQMSGILREVCPADVWTEFESRRDTDFVYTTQTGQRFRCHYFFDIDGIGANISRIATETQTLTELGLPEVLQRICEYRDGLVLITGPAGCGKSRTVAAIVDYINSEQSRFIVTLESPIEIFFQNRRSIIVQREIGRHCPDLCTGLQQIGRSSPDVIVITDEIQDAAALKQVVTCAAMGSLVICTMYTTSAAKTLHRLMTLFPPDRLDQIRTMLVKNLSAIITQILCETVDGGKVAAHEIAVRSAALTAAVETGNPVDFDAAREAEDVKGMQSLDDCLRNLLASNIISPMEAYMKAVDKRAFAEFLPEQTFWSAEASAPQRPAPQQPVPLKARAAPKDESSWIP